MRGAQSSWRLIVLIAALGTFLIKIPGHAMSQPNQPPGDPPPSQYQTNTIEGWTILVNTDFLQQSPELSERTLTLLRHQLYQIVRRLPAEAVKKLRKIRIWVEENEPNTPCMAYHPSRAWLEEHGMNPAKAKCVELSNARNFLAWTLEQPWMVLHELSHAYHDQFLENGFQNPAVRAAFDRAMKLKLYQKVLRINGRDDPAYAAVNPKEYFAEMTESYFGTNDFYPFVQSELKRHDPAAYDLLSELWGVAKPAVADQEARPRPSEAGSSKTGEP